MHRLSSLVFALFAAAHVHSFNIFPHHKAIIHARQAPGSSSLPGGEGWGVCESQCKPWETYTNNCAGGADALACYCSATYIDGMVNCYDCLLPLAQQTATPESHVEDFPAQAQQAVDDVAQACTNGGHPVTAPKLSAGSSSPPATDTGTSATASLSTSSAAGETESAVASGASPSGSEVPTSGNNPNGAYSVSMSSYVVAVGAMGVTMIGLLA